MNRPDHNTSNYGWALWHLERAESPNETSTAARHHAQMAQARATLAQIDALESFARDGSTWSGT